MKILHFLIIVILGFSILFVTGQAYAPCIEGPGINCNNYPPPSLAQITSDKLNYETLDKPIVTIMGAPDAVAHLEIDDSSSNIIFTHDISLAPNGTVKYVLDISSYKPGVYFIIATSPISKLTTSFAIGLAPIGGPIALNTDRNSYLPGDNVTIVGAWNPNTLIQLSLIDPNGISVKSMRAFSDITGHFSSFDFSIPHTAISGTWKFDATSGVNHSSVNITVENTTSTQIDKAIILSPLKQFKSGIALKDIKCAPDFQLVIKAKNRSPACVKPDDVSKLVEREWADKPHSLQEEIDFANVCLGTNDACRHSYDAKSNDPFGITALIIYHPPDVCLNLVPPSNNVTMHGCPPNTFYLKINSASPTYLMGYNICDGDSCTKANDISVLLPIKDVLTPNFQMIGLPVDLKWKYGDTVEIQLYASSTNDNKTASLVNIGNSTIVP